MVEYILVFYLFAYQFLNTFKILSCKKRTYIKANSCEKGLLGRKKGLFGGRWYDGDKRLYERSKKGF